VEPLVVILGWLLHHAKVLMQIKANTNEIWWPHRYIRERPYKLAISILGTSLATIMVYVIFKRPEPMAHETYISYIISYIAAGYLGDAMVDKLISTYSK